MLTLYACCSKSEFPAGMADRQDEEWHECLQARKGSYLLALQTRNVRVKQH